MQVFTKKEHLTSYLKSLQASKIGFVPTMGALHAGHLSLVAEALKDNDATVVSVFINPTQFNNPEDLIKYPKDIQADLEFLENYEPELIVFCPSPEEIYGKNITSTAYNFDGIEHEMEGAFRPGHFDGVGTVLSLFFNIVTPHNAYFGEKDFQQLQIIKKLTLIENLPINIIGCSIYRESNGLAFSSRNKRLSSKNQKKSSLIYQILKKVKVDFGTKSVIDITENSKLVFEKHPDFKLEYFIIAETETLKKVTNIDPSKKYRAFVAVYIEGVRLIDNIALN